MSPDEFKEFRHKAVHELMRLNEHCKEEFRISKWPRWDYDLDRATLIFSEKHVPKVVASIQVAGTTSKGAGTWLWGWANHHLPPQSTRALRKVKAFGKKGKIPELTKPSAPDDEYLGWEMTAIAAQVLGSKGAYRCPSGDGYVYVVYTEIHFATEKEQEQRIIECDNHGSGFATYICEHLIANPAQKWFGNKPDKDDEWPDAWCAACEKIFQEQGEWNEKNEGRMKIKLLCHWCYEDLRAVAKGS